MTIRLSLAICIGCFAVTGCSTTGGYVDDVNQIQDQVVDAASSVGSDLNASKKEVLDSLANAQAEAEEAVGDLREIDVPADAEEGHAELIKGFEDLEKLYGEIRGQVESGSGGSALTELRAKSADIEKKIDSALGQINDDLGLD